MTNISSGLKQNWFNKVIIPNHVINSFVTTNIHEVKLYFNFNCQSSSFVSVKMLKATGIFHCFTSSRKQGSIHNMEIGYNLHKKC